MLDGTSEPWPTVLPGDPTDAEHLQDVLRLVDIAQHRLYGTWRRTTNGLQCDSGPFARVAIPVAPDGGYEVQIQFTRFGGTADNVLILPVRRTACGCAISPDFVEFQIAPPEGIGTVRGKFPQTPLPDGKKHIITARIVLETALVRVQVDVDGKRQIDWSGPESALSPREEWRLFPNSLGIGSHNQGIIFHRVRLQTLTGRAVSLHWPGGVDGVHSRCLSFSGMTTAQLSESMDFANNDLKSLPMSRTKFGDVTFEVGSGILQLDSSKSRKPNKIEGIKVGRTAKRLHFLQGTRGYTSVDTIVAKYVIHYDNGTTVDASVAYDRDVTNWWHYPNDKALIKKPAAWEGEHASSSGAAATIKLYYMTWENPKPAMKTATVDFMSLDTGVTLSPFCVAITSEDD
jgi:hypothetical protein